MNRLLKFAQRLTSVHPKIRTKTNHLIPYNYSTINSAEDFVTIYKLPYIVPLSMINRLKYYHTVLTATALPISTLLYELNVTDVEILQIVASIGMLATKC